MTTDKLDWHWDAAESAGQPGEQGFVHIACFLAWVIERGLHAKRVVPKSLVTATLDGTATLDDYIMATDQRLSDHDLNAEARQFAAHSYDGYLEAYADAFEGVPEYTVPFDADTRRVTAALLDGLYAGWVEAGRPEPEPQGEHIEEAAEERLDEALDRALLDPVILPWDATPEQVEAILAGADTTRT